MEEFLKNIEEDVKTVVKIYTDDNSLITFNEIQQKIKIVIFNNLDYVNFLKLKRKYDISDETPTHTTLESTDKMTIEEFLVLTEND
jgi:hypothetical protein